MHPATQNATTNKLPYDAVQRWVIRLGWLSLSLWGLLVVTGGIPLEFISPNWQLAFRLLVTGAGWMWPLALSLELRRRIRPNGLRALLVAVAGLLTLPVLYFCLMMAVYSGMLHDDAWATKRTLWRRAEWPAARVVVQRYGRYASADDPWRVVQLTPILGLWQLVTPIDTTRFDANGWQRVRR